MSDWAAVKQGMHVARTSQFGAGKTRDLRDPARDPLQNVGDHGDHGIEKKES